MCNWKHQWDCNADELVMKPRLELSSENICARWWREEMMQYWSVVIFKHDENLLKELTKDRKYLRYNEEKYNLAFLEYIVQILRDRTRKINGYLISMDKILWCLALGCDTKGNRHVEK